MATREGTSRVALRADRHDRRIHPLVDGHDAWVQVDGHPICASCGRGIRPTGVNRWRHLPAGQRSTGRSRWLAPITLDAVRHTPTYAAFGTRFPWAVRADFGGPVVTSEEDWHEGVRRLEKYHAALDRVADLRTLPAGTDPYRELVGILMAPVPSTGPARGRRATGDWGLSAGLVQMLHLRERRRELAARFAWAIPGDEALDLLATYAPLVDGGAGTGYWAALLEQRGANVVAYDLVPDTRADNPFHRHRPWTRVHAASSVAAVRDHPDRTLFLCWPPYQDDSASYAPVRAYHGEFLAYVGESAGGATGSLRFHRELALNWTVVEQVDLPHWPRLRDRLVVYRRNERRRPLRERDRCDECRRFVPTGWIGRCDRCFTRRPPALALRAGGHRVEYSQAMLAAMPPALRWALEASPSRIR